MTIKQLEAVLAWAFDEELTRGSLAELSRKCAVDALVEGLRRGETSKGRPAS